MDYTSLLEEAKNAGLGIVSLAPDTRSSFRMWIESEPAILRGAFVVDHLTREVSPKPHGCVLDTHNHIYIKRNGFEALQLHALATGDLVIVSTPSLVDVGRCFGPTGSISQKGLEIIDNSQYDHQIAAYAQAAIALHEDYISMLHKLTNANRAKSAGQ